MSDSPRSSPPARPARRTPWRIAAEALARFDRRYGSLLAASISFYLLLSLVPMILLGLSGFGYVLQSDPRLLNELREQIKALLPTQAEFAQRIVEDVISQRWAFGGVGLAALLGTAVQALVTINQAVNVIWGVPQRRFWRARLFALQMMGVLGSLFVCTTVGAQLLRWAGGQPLLGRAQVVIQLANWALIPLISVTLFSLAYRWIPAAEPPSQRAAWGAGVIAGLAWELAKHPFTLYLANLRLVSVVPSSLGTFLGFAIWGYYSGFVLLLGVSLAASFSGRSAD